MQQLGVPQDASPEFDNIVMVRLLLALFCEATLIHCRTRCLMNSSHDGKEQRAVMQSVGSWAFVPAHTIEE